MGSEGSAIGKAVAATAASSLVIAGILFYVYHRFVMERWRRQSKAGRGEEGHQKLGGNVKGVLVNENGVDVLYLRKHDLEGGLALLNNTSTGTRSFPRVLSNPSFEEYEDVKRVDAGTQVPKPVIHLPPPPPPPPPPLPPVLAKKSPLAPPPPPMSKRPPKWKSNMRNKTGGEDRDKRLLGETKLKALHWDKLSANSDHSMVWDHINDGSLRFDDELIEALFGYSKNHKSPQGSSSSSSNNNKCNQIFILDPRKSQNTSIVLKSVAASRREIVDALVDGHGLSAETLEKLTKISPTKEEEAKILQFSGNPTRLADAESFLHYILKAVPSAFACFRGMLFRVTYDPEVLHLKESLQTLELGCRELRTRGGLFQKLLEAILKAGNRLNAGTPRGNAQGFNLSALRKLSDVKSTNGNSTLLHFVVEQVATAEGRRTLLNNNMMTQQEYMMEGLPALRSLSSEFVNVRRAAGTEYESFASAWSGLSGKVGEARKVVGTGGFAREMRGFLEECEGEMEVVREEQGRVMDLVRRTNRYYQADTADHPLHMFRIVADFLDMVDKVCADISAKLQRSNAVTVRTNASPPPSPTMMRTPIINFRSQFLAEAHATPSTDSEDDF